MIAKIIRDYIEGGARKLTVPGFGTFMRREGGEVVFVDLLRTDDGVLCELVEDYGSYPELEAMALVDRFAFETKKSIERQGSAVLEGFGVMRRDEGGNYQFDYTPAARPMKETAVQEDLFKAPVGMGSGHGADPTPAERKISARPTPRGGNRRVSEETRVAHNSSHNSPRPKPNKKADTILVIAVIAAIIAIIALAFGLSTGNMPFLK